MSINRYNTRVGVAAFITKINADTYCPSVLVGKRLSISGYGTWSLPGGKIEFGENPKEAVIREVFEETGLYMSFDSTNLVKEHEYSSSIVDEVHWITLFYTCSKVRGILENKEPDKCAEWHWVAIRDLLSLKLFDPLYQLLAKSVGNLSSTLFS